VLPQPHQIRLPLARPSGKPLIWDACCREGHASLLLQQGANLAEVSRRLGHSSVVVTARHYAGITQDDQVRLGSSLEALKIA
jgi:integrase